MPSISLSPSCAPLRAAFQSLIVRVALYTLSSDFEMQPRMARKITAIDS